MRFQVSIVDTFSPTFGRLRVRMWKVHEPDFYSCFLMECWVLLPGVPTTYSHLAEPNIKENKEKNPGSWNRVLVNPSK